MLRQFDVIKYSYRKSIPRKTKLQLLINKTNRNKYMYIHYSKKYNKPKLIDNIIGIIFGTRTRTYKKIIQCKPWLCISIVREDRTYDFEFKLFGELIYFLIEMKYFFPDLINISKIREFRQQCILIEKQVSETFVNYFNRLYFDSVYKRQFEANECPVCLENQSDNIKLAACDHIFCNQCFVKWSASCLSRHSRITCPLCRIDINKPLPPSTTPISYRAQWLINN